MTDAVLLKIGYVVVAVFSYGFLRWRLMVTTHDFRVRAGSEAMRWAADDRISADMRNALQGWVDRMYRPMTPWLVVFRALIVVFIPTQWLAHAHAAAMSSVPPDARRDVARLNVRLVFAAVTTSPLASFATFLILFLGLVVRASLEVLWERVAAIPETRPRPTQAA